MIIDFEPSFLADVLAAEAKERDLGGRLASMAANREADGLDGAAAVVDAAESLGLVGAVRQEVQEWLAPLAALELERVVLQNAHGGMPTLRKTGPDAELTLEAASLAEQKPVLLELTRAATAQPDRNTFVLAVGLGGTGGCACGEDLPEDAPPGPLFERR